MRPTIAKNTGGHADHGIGFETGYLRLIRALFGSTPPAAMPGLSLLEPPLEPYVIAHAIAGPLIRGHMQDGVLISCQ
jgi:hypothetical protein